MRKHRLLVVAVCVGALGLSGCGFSNSYYLSGVGSKRPVLRQMLANLNTSHSSREHRFLFMQEIIKILRTTKGSRRLNLFLTDYVAKHRKDPYDAYYLYVVAENYARAHAYPFARVYFNQILTDYPNIDVHGSSIDYRSLKELLKITSDPNRQITYYHELLSHYRGKINEAATYYNLAKDYHRIGRWGKEMQAYEDFLQQPQTTVPGVPNAKRRATYLVDLYNYPDKNWAYANLNTLVNHIRYAVDRRSTRLLSRYWAKVGFFARSWEPSASWDPGMRLLMPLFLRRINAFMSARVWIAPSLDIQSDQTEAYLQTGGWSWRIPQWYFYFKKINFPEDPKIQGKWEWAGIYFGYKLFWSPGL